jgi:invasion protein IalB
MRANLLGGSLAIAASFAWASIAPVEGAHGDRPLPGGATSLQEMHGDWRVACAQQNGRNVCALSQQQTDKDSHQLLLAIELNPSAIDKAEGTLILPFGLARPPGHASDRRSGGRSDAARLDQ